MGMIIKLPNIDYEGGVGYEANPVEIEVSMDSYFSMSANIWYYSKYDCVRGGQCQDTLREYYKDNEEIIKLLDIWDKYQLKSPKNIEKNDLEFLEFLEKNPNHFVSNNTQKSIFDLDSDTTLTEDSKEYIFETIDEHLVISRNFIEDLLNGDNLVSRLQEIRDTFTSDYHYTELIEMSIDLGSNYVSFNRYEDEIIDYLYEQLADRYDDEEFNDILKELGRKYLEGRANDFALACVIEDISRKIMEIPFDDSKIELENKYKQIHRR